MDKNNIVSFSDFVKKKRSALTIDAQFLNALSADIKSKPELIEWYNFQNLFNKHKLFWCSSANTLKKVRDFFGSLCIVVMGRCPHEKTKELESTLSKQKL